jgi:hypothetical protein
MFNKRSIQAIINFCNFLYHFDIDIEKMINLSFSKDENTIHDLVLKWSGIVKKNEKLGYVSPQMILDFITSISKKQSEILINWIISNHDKYSKFSTN